MSAINSSIEHRDRDSATAHRHSVIRHRELVVSLHAVYSRYISRSRFEIPLERAVSID